MKYKYIIFKTERNGEQVLIFGMNTNHDNIAHAIGEESVVSAGFVNIDIRNDPYGSSVSFDMISRPEKDKHIMLSLGGI